MENTLFNQDIVSITALSKQQIELILTTAKQFESQPYPDLLKGKIIASCFFEVSTRTRLSFESAACKLGASVIGFDNDTNTSGKKGETLWDTIKVVSNYCDGLVIRHPEPRSAKLAADAADVPIINAGDGSNQHPSQTLLDLFTMQQKQGRLDRLKVALVGDLKYGRTVHSLAQALALWNARLYFVSPDTLSMPDDICHYLHQHKIIFSCHQDMQEIIGEIDVLYMTRLQTERFSHNDTEQVSNHLVVTPELVRQGKDNLCIMHPLPRVHEVEAAVDDMPQACYFQQIANSIPVRQAILALLLHQKLL